MSQLSVWFERKFEFSFPVELYPNVMARLRGTPARVEEVRCGWSIICILLPNTTIITWRESGSSSIRQSSMPGYVESVATIMDYDHWIVISGLVWATTSPIRTAGTLAALRDCMSRSASSDATEINRPPAVWGSNRSDRMSAETRSS
jgi:hypothetical protein